VSAHFHKKHRRPRKPSGPRREKIEELHPIEETPSVESFDGWDLGPEIHRGIAAMDISVPTPIQALSIGPILEGRDVIAKAQTGTGKTLAFGAPMMARIDPARATVLGLVLCPTRELAQQVHGVLATLGLPRGVRVALAVGGDPIHPQIADLQAGAQVVVGTPGRVLDLYQQRFLSFPWTEYVVLDEADKMFEIGFLDDIKRILSYTPDERQTLLFSATFPTEVLKLARESTRDPLEVATAAGTVTVDTVEQNFMELADEDRPRALLRILEQSGEGDVFLVFCGRRTEVDRLMRSLERQDIPIKALHGGYDQAARFRVMAAFRTGEVKALIATDVASRGLDVQHVTHVINYSCPRDAEDYTHRIGRTGRAGRSGTAITFVCPMDRRRWRDILNRTKADVNEMAPPERTGRPPRERGRDADREREDRGEGRSRARGRGRSSGRGRERGQDDRRPAPASEEPRGPAPRRDRGEEGPVDPSAYSAPPGRGDEGEQRGRRAGSSGRSGTRGSGRGRSGERREGESGGGGGGRQGAARKGRSDRGDGQRRSEQARPHTVSENRRRRGGRGGRGGRRPLHETDDLGRWGDRADDFG
jgi:superfamily II DNA/RNA helicase